MSQISKFKYEDIKKYIEENNCELLSKDYQNMKQKLSIKCSCGDIFEITLDSFKNKNKRRCKKCSNKLKSDKRRIKYEYVKKYIEDNGCELLSKKIDTAHDVLKIKCVCGNGFEKSFNKFKSSKQNRCRECTNKPLWTVDKVKNYIEKESNSGCKLKSKEYKNKKQYLQLICKCGEDFGVTFHDFLHSNKRQCNNCGYKISANKNKKGIEYLKQFVQKNSKSELLSEEYENYHHKLKFKCECGKIFDTSFVCFMNGKTRCDLCSFSNSTMERFTELFLDRMNVEFKKEFEFDDLKGFTKRKLRFDFAIKDADGELILLELDGEQHFKPIKYFGGLERFKRNEAYDKLKDRYCEERNILLLRISYKDNLEEKLNEIIYKYVNPVPSLDRNILEG